jgi:hypothetical protein
VTRFTWLIAVLAVTPLLLLAACGDDDEGSGSEDFLAEADAACIDGGKRINELYAEEGIPQSFDEDVDLLGKRLPLSEQGVEEASALEPPDDLADEYDEYLAERETFVDLLRQQLEAGEAGNEAQYQSFGPQLDESSDAIDQSAEEVGLEACAQILPEDQVEDVRAVIDDTATTGDPAHCTEDYTENYVEGNGGLERCETGENDPANQAESVEISDVKGLEDVYATASVVPTGGPGDGQELIVELVFEEDRWKIDAIFPVQPDPQAGTTQ